MGDEAAVLEALLDPEALIAKMESMEPDERLRLFVALRGRFCLDCGRRLTPPDFWPCQCENDE